jgi:hypothetical protein
VLFKQIKTSLLSSLFFIDFSFVIFFMTAFIDSLVSRIVKCEEIAEKENERVISVSKIL